MSYTILGASFLFLCIILFANSSTAEQVGRNVTGRCDIPPTAPKKIEEVINQCQDEIKIAILAEALEALNVNDNAHSRTKRAAFNDDERRIAGLPDWLARNYMMHLFSAVPAQEAERFKTGFNWISSSIEKKGLMGLETSCLITNPCLLQCVYRKMNALNPKGFPTVEGLVSLYTDGVDQKDYIVATLQSVTKCLGKAQKELLTIPQFIDEHGVSCDVAYDVFDCISEEIGKYCGQTP